MYISRLQEIDFIKGIAIASVILLHTCSAEMRSSLFSAFHIGQAVPIFITITFILSFRSIEHQGGRLRYWFSTKRIRNVFSRIVLPILFISLLQITVGVALGYNHLINKLIQGGGTARGPIISGYIFSYGYSCHFCTAS